MAITRNPLHFLLLAAGGVILTGCIGPGGRSALDSYIGRSVAEYAASHGEPGSSVKWSDHEGSFSWDTVGHPIEPAIGSAATISEAPAALPPTVCTVSLIATTQSPKPALKDWTVQSWRRQGTC